MRRGLLFVALAVLLASCVPALAPVPVRDGETVTITLAPNQDLYSVTLSVLNATTDDERCVPINEADVGCVLGNLEANTTTSVVVVGDVGAVRCSAFGFTSPTLAVNTYRAWPCQGS